VEGGAGARAVSRAYHGRPGARPIGR